jgi:hypothetical protein
MIACLLSISVPKWSFWFHIAFGSFFVIEFKVGNNISNANE